MSLFQPCLFLFRRDKEDSQQREEAFTHLFDKLNVLYADASRMKTHWYVDWQARSDTELPPKFQSSRFDHPGAVEAARDVRSAQHLLQHNRWSSKLYPLFETVDERAWSQLRSTGAQTPASLRAITGGYSDGLREDEITWIERSNKSFERIRRELGKQEARNAPSEEIVATFVAGNLVTAISLSENLLDRLRQDAVSD